MSVPGDPLVASARDLTERDAHHGEFVLSGVNVAIRPVQRHFVDSPKPTMIKPNPITMFHRPNSERTGMPGAM